MIKVLTKIGAKIIINAVENREPYYFIIIYKCKKVPLSLFSYQMLASTFDFDEWSSYYKVYDYRSNRTSSDKRVPDQIKKNRLGSKQGIFLNM